jgi:hypothetical protein
MSDTVTNPVSGMYKHRGKTVNQFGLDKTGLVEYRFNQQGFRSDRNFDFIPDWAIFGCSFVAGIGVANDQIFSSKFTNSQNYGVCGTYHNYHIRNIIQRFLNSNLFSYETKMAIFWTDRGCDMLETYYHELKHLDIRFFFCGSLLPYPRCHRVISNLDFDVSGTHMGPKTHEFLYRVLCQT